MGESPHSEEGDDVQHPQEDCHVREKYQEKSGVENFLGNFAGG